MTSKLTRCPVCGSEYTDKRQVAATDIETIKTIREMVQQGDTKKAILEQIDSLLKEITR